VDDKRGKKIRENLKNSAQKIEDLNCTFKPNINPYPGYPGINSYDEDKSISISQREILRYQTDLTPGSWNQGIYIYVYIHICVYICI
jgi:hypothetical protein